MARIRRAIRHAAPPMTASSAAMSLIHQATRASPAINVTMTVANPKMIPTFASHPEMAPIR